MLVEGDERGGGGGVGQLPPPASLSPPRPAALPRSAHVSESSNAGPGAACARTHARTNSRTYMYKNTYETDGWLSDGAQNVERFARKVLRLRHVRRLKPEQVEDSTA